MLPFLLSRSHASTNQLGASHAPARCKKPHRPSAPAQTLPVIIRSSLSHVVSMACPRGSSYHTPPASSLVSSLPYRIHPPGSTPRDLHPSPHTTTCIIGRGVYRSSSYLYNASAPCALLSSLHSCGTPPPSAVIHLQCTPPTPPFTSSSHILDIPPLQSPLHLHPFPRDLAHLSAKPRLQYPIAPTPSTLHHWIL